MDKSKKSQFYIIAALIIILVIIGLISIGVEIKRGKEYKKIYDLGEELKIETGSVYDYGVYKGKNTSKLIGKWAKKYYEYSKGKVVEDWIFIYGNNKSMTVLTFTMTSSGNITIIFPGGKGKGVNVEIEREVERKKSFEPGSEKKINLIFKNLTYEFELEEGENFFFVIREEGGASTKN